MPDGFGDGFTSGELLTWTTRTTSEGRAATAVLAALARHLRHDHNMTIREVADRLGVRLGQARLLAAALTEKDET